MLRVIVSAASIAFMMVSATLAQTGSRDELVQQLQRGGFVIVMRHASSPLELPGPRAIVPGNVHGERQLDERGLQEIVAMRFAIRELGIPIGDVYTSEAFRARETALHFGFGDRHVMRSLGAEDMESAGQAEFDALSELAATMPRAGTNAVIITHGPQLRGAFGTAGAALAAGDALIVRPTAEGPEIVTTVAIRDWPGIALN
jgi:phosphohistidine phosphatase SixA